MLLNSTLSPHLDIRLGPVELARIDCHAVQAYEGGVFSHELVDKTEVRARLILETEIARLGPEPKMPQWVANYAARDFQPCKTDPTATLDENDWAAAMGDSGRVISERMLADTARAWYFDRVRDMRLRQEEPRFTTPKHVWLGRLLGLGRSVLPIL